MYNTGTRGGYIYITFGVGAVIAFPGCFVFSQPLVSSVILYKEVWQRQCTTAHRAALDPVFYQLCVYLALWKDCFLSWNKVTVLRARAKGNMLEVHLLLQINGTLDEMYNNLVLDYHILYRSPSAILSQSTISTVKCSAAGIGCQNKFQNKIFRARSQKKDNGNEKCRKIPLIPPYHRPGPFLGSETAYTCFSLTMFVFRCGGFSSRLYLPPSDSKKQSQP